MPDFLQTTVDKFTFQIAKDRLYTSDSVWLLPTSAQRVRVGISDYFQQHNGDIAFVNVKAAGTSLTAGEGFADIETMKVTVELPSPMAGTIVSVNPALAGTPEIVNQEPYEKGWLAEIEPRDWQTDRAKLLDASAYLTVMRAQAEEELKS